AYRAAEQAGAIGADTAEIVQRFRTLEVALIEGEPGLFKVTYDQDLVRAEAEAADWWQDVGR
ncbi:MAG: 2-C-methyl-D-erythritol 4-phosphate cytidylyltransferase, partial [Acidimicrobiia bacterium]